MSRSPCASAVSLGRVSHRTISAQAGAIDLIQGSDRSVGTGTLWATLQLGGWGGGSYSSQGRVTEPSSSMMALS